MNNLISSDTNIISHSTSSENPRFTHENAVNQPEWQRLLAERGILEAAPENDVYNDKKEQHDIFSTFDVGYEWFDLQERVIENLIESGTSNE